MSRREREVVLGAIVFVAIIIVVVGAVWLSEQYAGAAGGYRLYVTFDSVPGLQRGNPVNVRGFRVGKVLGIQLDRGVPLVALGFSELEGMPRDSKVFLKSEGLLGGQMIEIQLGQDTGRTYADGDTLAGEPGADLEKLLSNAIGISGNIDSAVQELVGQQNLRKVERILAEIDSTTSVLKETLSENRGSLSGAIKGLESAAAGAQGVLGDNRKDVRAAVANLKLASEQIATVSGTFDSASVSLESTLSDLHEITARLRRGEGSLGLLLKDDRLYHDLTRTLVSVDSLVQAVKNDPGKYFKFSVF